MRALHGVRNASISHLSVYASIFLMVLLECSLFYLSIVPQFVFTFANYNAKYASSAIVLLGLLYVVAVPQFRSSPYIFWAPIAAFSAMCFVTAVVSAEFYGSSITASLVRASPYILVPLCYFTLHSVVRDNVLYNYFVGALIWIPAIYALFCILQASGVAVMDPEFQYMSYRSGRLRLIMSGDVIAFGAVVALGRILSDRTANFKYVAPLICMVFELLWVAQTRFLVIGVLVSSVWGILVKGKRRKIKVVAVALAIGVIALRYSNQFNELLFPEELNTSSVARVNAYRYYWSHFTDMKVLGLGYVPPTSGAGMFGLVWDYYGEARGDITDIGVVGYLARYGICGALVMILAITAACRQYLKHRVECLSEQFHVEAWMALMFIVAISPTMAVTDSQRIFFLPVSVILVERALTSKREL